MTTTVDVTVAPAPVIDLSVDGAAGDVVNLTVSEPSVVQVDVGGEVGPPGPAGSGGGAGYTHTQTLAASVWTVQHNLGFNPQPTVLDDTGQQLLGWAVTWPTVDTLILTFPASFAGTAHVS